MSKILIFGDSIAYGKWDSEGGWVARLRKHIDQTYNLDKPTNFQVHNVSIAGEVMPHMVKRFASELDMRILQEEATNKKNLVILALGINDSCSNNWLTKEQTPEKIFIESLRSLIRTSLEKNCKIIVVGLTPVNAIKSIGLLFTNREVKKYDSYISTVCREEKVLKLQLFEDLVTTNYAELLMDVVHPNDQGHALIVNKVIHFLMEQKLFDYLLS